MKGKSIWTIFLILTIGFFSLFTLWNTGYASGTTITVDDDGGTDFQEIQDAILGNVGTLMTFIVGAQDAQVLDKEFGKDFDVDDLVSLGKYQILIKMSINDRTSKPFSASTLPLPSCNNKNYDKIIKMSRAQFGRNRKKS